MREHFPAINANIDERFSSTLCGVSSGRKHKATVAQTTVESEWNKLWQHLHTQYVTSHPHILTSSHPRMYRTIAQRFGNAKCTFCEIYLYLDFSILMQRFRQKKTAFTVGTGMQERKHVAGIRYPQGKRRTHASKSDGNSLSEYR